jgi:hypothetical protein
MKIFNFFESLIDRTSHFGWSDWLLAAACFVLAFHAIGISRRQ